MQMQQQQQAPQQQAPQQPQQQAAPVPTAQPTLNASDLAKLPTGEAKRTIGEHMYPRIAELHGPEFAGKITGMLLEMDNSELLHLLENKEELAQRAQEARNVLAAYKPKA
jgi:polyadenylate-binding protein